MSTKTLVTTENLDEVIKGLCARKTLVFDSETTGLSSFHNSEIFSLAVSTLDGDAYYFNFKDYPQLETKFVLGLSALSPLFEDSRDWVAHNAKFDLHMMKRAGFELKGKIFDTAVLARIYENHWSYRGGYSLDACAKRWLSIEKDDRVKEYMEENSLYISGSGTDGRPQKNYFFYLVPFEIISEYAMQDAIVTGELYQFFFSKMYPNDVLLTEVSLTRVLFEMEQRGVLLDTSYVKKAFDFENLRLMQVTSEIEENYPLFKDSPQYLEPVLTNLGVTLTKTEKGEFDTSEKTLKAYDSIWLVRKLLEFRDAQKRSQTYWYNYQNLADKNGVVHPIFNQGGTATGRMSCSQPNLQNIPNEDSGPYPVRRAFIPRPNFQFVAIDYKQMEFRLMLEYAREMNLINKIKTGHDPHDATAEMTGLSRKAAKTLNFGLLYGMGIQKLGDAIGVDYDTAKKFKWEYFGALPGVKWFIQECSRRMEARGYAVNVFGRRSYLEDKKWAYKAANAVIQGGTADIVKLAMVELAKFLEDKKSAMVLQIHDEVVFEVHESELDIIPQLKLIMEQTFKAKLMPMECSVEKGLSLQDLENYDHPQIPA